MNLPVRICRLSKLGVSKCFGPKSFGDTAVTQHTGSHSYHCGKQRILFAQLRMLIEQLAEYEAPSERHVVVLNHIFAAQLVKTEDLRRSLQLPVDDEIPYDPLLFLKAANEGIPIVISAPSSLPGQAFRRLATALVGPVTQAPTPELTLKGKRPLLRGLLGRNQTR